MSKFVVEIGENKRVNVTMGGHTISTDQPEENGGDNSAMSPYNVYLSSIAACSGIFISSFFKKRDLNTDGLSIAMVAIESADGHGTEETILEVTLPKDFPEKYIKALNLTLDQCSVKKSILNPPKFTNNVHLA